MKVSYKLEDYTGIKNNKFPKQIKQYVKYHSSAYEPALNQLKSRLEERFKTAKEQPEKLIYQQDFISTLQDQIKRFPEVIEDLGVFHGDIDRCVRDSQGYAFWIDFGAMEDDRIAYWEQKIADAENMIRYAQSLPASEHEQKLIAIAKCEEKIKLAKSKNYPRSSQSVKRAVFKRILGESQ